MPNSLYDEELGGSGSLYDVELGGPKIIKGPSLYDTELEHLKVGPVPEPTGPNDFSKLQSELHRESVGEVVEGFPTAGTPYGGTIGLKSVLGRDLDEFDENIPGPILSEENKENFKNNMSQLFSLAKNPYDIIKGTAELVTQIPGFMLSVLPAMRSTFEKQGSHDTLLDLWEDFWTELEGPMGWWQENITDPVGKVFDMPREIRNKLRGKLGMEPEGRRGDESEMVGKIFMAPLTVATESIYAIADDPFFDDRPNWKGAIKISGDAIGFTFMGMFYKGGREALRKDLDVLVKKGIELKKEQVKIDAMPESGFKEAAKAKLEMNANQAEMEAGLAMKRQDFDKMIRKDLSSKTTQIKRAKQPDKHIADEQIDKALREKDRLKIKQTGSLRDRFLAEVKPGEKGYSEAADKFAKSLTKDDIVELEAFKAELIERQKTETNLDDKARTGSAIGAINEAIQTAQGKKPKSSKVKVEEPTTDLDMQTGTPEPPALSTHKSPFRETPKQTEFRKGIYEGRKSVAKSIDELITQDPTVPLKDVSVTQQKLTNDVNRWLNGEEVDIASSRNFLSELAARADELRMLFDNPSDFASWKKGVSEAAIWARRVKREKVEPGQELYSGIPLDKLKNIFKRKAEGKPIDPKKLSAENLAMYKKVEGFEAAFVAAEKAKNKDWGKELKRAGISTYRALHEKSGLLRNALVKKYGQEGWELIQRIDSEISHASTGYAQSLFKQMEKEALRGLSAEDIAIVNRINMADRLADIYGYRIASEYKTPKGMEPDATVLYQKLLKDYKGLTPEKYAELKRASDIVFEHHRMWVDLLVESGIKSAEEGKLLKSHNYRRMQKFTVENLFDEPYKSKVGEKVVRQTDSGVDPLGKGSYDMLETDTKGLSLELAARIAGRVYNNDMKTAWWNFVEKNPTNPYCWVSGMKDATGKKIPPPKEWVKDYRYIDGKKHEMRFHPDVATQILSRGGEISFWLTKVLTHGLGISTVRTLAVSTSATWAMTRGLTMDIAHSFFSPRVFEKGAKGLGMKETFPWIKIKEGRYKKIYSPIAPVFMKEIGRNMNNVKADVFTRGPKLRLYEKYGGHMPFLTQRDTKAFKRGKKGLRVPNQYEKALDAASWIGKSAELWNRVAVMERVLERRAKQNRVTLEEAYKNEAWVREAVHVSRERLPYAQGGWLVKSLDNMAGPFISASYNAARTMWRSAYENPIDFSVRLANIGVPTAGITIAALMLWPEAERDVPEYVHRRNAVIHAFSDHLKFKDLEGNDRYFYFKIPLEPSVAFFYNVFRGMAKKTAFETGITKIEPDYGTIVDSLKTLSPIESGFGPPLGRAIASYWTDYSLWKDRNIVPPENAFDYPKSEIEGMYDPRVSQIAKDFGKLTKASPARTEGAIGELIPSSNEYVFALTKAYEKAFNELDPRAREQHWAITLSKIPGVKAFMGVTVPRAYRTEDRREMKEETEFDRYIRVNKLDGLAEAFYWKGVGSEREIDDHIDEYKEDDWKVESMEKKVEFIQMIKDLPHRSSWSGMWYASPEDKALDYWEIWNVESTKEERSNLYNELIILEDAGYTSERFDDRLEELKLYEPTPKVQVD